MVALLLVQPALGLEFVRLGKHGRIPRRREVAEGDQRLHRDTAQTVSIHTRVSAAHPRARTNARFWG